jgi:hypothetical protein
MNLSKSRDYEPIVVMPASIRGWQKTKVAAQFGTVSLLCSPKADGIISKYFSSLIMSIVNSGTLSEFQVVQVWVIFKLPHHFKTFQEPLAYVELFMPFKAVPDEDGIYTVQRSMQRGKQHSKVVQLSEVILSCHLVPEFGGCGNQWTSETALEKGVTFHLNHFSSVLNYMLIHFNKLF